MRQKGGRRRGPRRILLPGRPPGRGRIPSPRRIRCSLAAPHALAAPPALNPRTGALLLRIAAPVSVLTDGLRTLAAAFAGWACPLLLAVADPVLVLVDELRTVLRSWTLAAAGARPRPARAGAILSPVADPVTVRVDAFRASAHLLGIAPLGCCDRPYRDREDESRGSSQDHRSLREHGRILSPGRNVSIHRTRPGSRKQGPWP